ncbi:hypothetical protein NMY22_g16586 [Coprinellus aureogranulatus]|nr:hypothetical protein NMY22_g16586 [Coprinellus aureogranulatus]
MAYLFQCAKDYISDTHGVSVWSSLEGDIMYVLTHPNGWGGPQQAQMRQAAMTAGLVPNTEEGHGRVTFVTEGEASLHFCLSNGLVINGDSHSGVLIVDAGGGTIDLTAYRKFEDHTFEEIAIPKCYFQGAAFVTMRAKEYFKKLLRKSRFFQDVDTITTRFDRNTKHVFRRADEPHHIQFASHREKDPALNIRSGRLTLPGTEVASFFEPSISCIVQAIKDQVSAADIPIKTVFLVGGFSASSWLFESVRKGIEPLGIAVSRPDAHVNKAVSNGAVSFYLDGVVGSRVARATYGVGCYSDYDSYDPEHRKRGHKVTIHEVTPPLSPRYEKSLTTTMIQNTRVKKTEEFRSSFCTYEVDRGDLNSKKVSIRAYCGKSDYPKWMDDEPVKTSIRRSTKGGIYHKLAYDIVLRFGLTELQAQIAYKEDGVEKRVDTRRETQPYMAASCTHHIGLLPTISYALILIPDYAIRYLVLQMPFWLDWFRPDCMSLSVSQDDQTMQLRSDSREIDRHSTASRASSRRDRGQTHPTSKDAHWSKHRDGRNADSPVPNGHGRTENKSSEPPWRNTRIHEGFGSPEGNEQRLSQSDSVRSSRARHEVRGNDALRTWEFQRAEMESVIQAQQGALEQRETEVDQLFRQLRRAREESSRWEEHANSLERQINSRAAEEEARNAQLARALTLAEEDNEALRKHGVDAQHQLEELRSRIERGEEHFEKTKKLLDARTEELKAAQTFLTAADQHSIADISHMVDQLNEEIYQCTVMMSDALLDQRAARFGEFSAQEQASRKEQRQKLEQKWGSGLLSRLEADLSQDDTILFESLVESTLVFHCYDVIHAFSFASREFDNWCLAMWDGIKRSFDTPVAKRWLAMTLSQLKAEGVNQSDIVRDLGGLMVVAGWSSQAKTTGVPQKVREKVEELVERALKIKEAVTEGILSAEVDVFYHLGGALYNRASMRDAYDMGRSTHAQRSSTEDTIICSTGLGVQIIKKDGIATEEHPGGRGRKEVVLKPKVLLPSALEPMGGK